MFNAEASLNDHLRIREKIMEEKEIVPFVITFIKSIILKMYFIILIFLMLNNGTNPYDKLDKWRD